MHRPAAFAALAFVPALAAVALADVAPPRIDPEPSRLTLVNKIELDGGRLVLGGAPTPEELAAFDAAGFVTVIDLRTPGEPGREAEQAQAAELGMTWKALPVAAPAGVTRENARAMRALLAESTGPVLLHCASGNRVGALFAIAAADLDGASVEDAIAVGKARGLTRLEAVVREVLAPAAK